MNRLTTWWHGRNTREQRMLLVMAVSIALFVYVYGLMRPAYLAREAARDRHAAQQSSAREVREGLDRLRADQAVASDQDPLQAVLDSAGAAGVAISSQRSDGDALAIAIDAVDAASLFAWLDTLRSHHGIAPHALHIEKRDGRLQAQLQFSAAR